MAVLRFHKSLAVGWFLGLATAAVLGGLAGILMIFSGIYDTSARSAHSKVVAWAIHKTMIHSVQRRASELSNLPASASFWAGAREYESHCLSCHGGPGVDRAGWAKGMLPTPPFLVDSSNHWSRRELYNIVHDGVKMTGMPAWSAVDSDQQVADVVEFLQVMPKLTPRQFQQAMGKVRSDHQAR